MEINRYQLGKIYKLTSEHTDKIYIGSTCKKLLCQRLAHHSSRYKQWKKEKSSYVSSFELFELGSVQINLLESCPCNTRDELLSRERYWIEKYKDITFNKYLPIMTCEEKKEKVKNHNELNKEIILSKRKKYYEANKEIICQKNRERKILNKEKILIRRKELYKDKGKEKSKNYYEANKEKILEERKQKHICLCGMEITISHKLRHEKTIKHLKYINELTP